MKKLIIVSLVLTCTLPAIAQRGYVERAIEKKYADKYGKPGAEKGHDWINNHLLNVKVEPEYQFHQDYKIHFTTYKKGTVNSESDMHYYLSNNNTIIGMEVFDADNKKKKSSNTFTIYDYKNNTMLLLDRDKKKGTAINLNAFMSKENIEKREKGESKNQKGTSTQNCKRSGKTKSIMGIPCEEWVCEDKEQGTRNELWVNVSVKGKVLDAQRSGPLAPYMMSGVGGMLMQGLMYKNGELQSKMETTEYNKNKQTILSTEDYRIN